MSFVKQSFPYDFILLTVYHAALFTGEIKWSRISHLPCKSVKLTCSHYYNLYFIFKYFFSFKIKLSKDCHAKITSHGLCLKFITRAAVLCFNRWDFISKLCGQATNFPQEWRSVSIYLGSYLCT